MKKIILLFCLFLIFGCASKHVPVEIYIDLEEKKDKTTYGNLSIVVKYLGENKIIDTLNTVDYFKKKEILKFKKAKIFLNIDYGDRNCGFVKVINQKGKLKYELYDNGQKKFIDLYFLKDKFKYQELVQLYLNDKINSQQGIHLNDWITDKNTSVTFSSSKLFDLSNINQHSKNYTIKDVSISIEKDSLKTLWFVNQEERRFTEKRKQHAKTLIHEQNGTTTISFKNLSFYIENAENFTLKKTFQIRSEGKKIVEFE